MTLADKIMKLRREHDWSQEQLAEQLGISRQSVSKWESGAAVPDLERILKMSDLFHVSVDYLVKEDMEEMEDDHEKTAEHFPSFYDGMGQMEDADLEKERMVSAEEAELYMQTVKETASKIAGGVVLCILSPVLLLLLSGVSEFLDTGITENMAAGIGITVLLVMIALAVLLFITYGMKLDKYEYLEKEPISLASGVRRTVEERKLEYEPEFRRNLACGVILCIVSVIPLILVSIVSQNEFFSICGVVVLLILVSLGVYLLVHAGMIFGSYQKLLQEGDYTERMKADSKKIEGFAGIYWCVVTAIYLGVSLWISFLEKGSWIWSRSWIIWPVAGILFGAVSGIIRMCSGKK